MGWRESWPDYEYIHADHCKCEANIRREQFICSLLKVLVSHVERTFKEHFSEHDSEHVSEHFRNISRGNKQPAPHGIEVMVFRLDGHPRPGEMKEGRKEDHAK